MICNKCHGDGFLEYDNSFVQYGIMHERWVVEKCNDCDGTGRLDDVNYAHAKSRESEKTSERRD